MLRIARPLAFSKQQWKISKHTRVLFGASYKRQQVKGAGMSDRPERPEQPDVEGHVNDRPEEPDVEGHMNDRPEQPDVEGHRLVDRPEEPDVEGHVFDRPE
jgi:hypothetical protein